MHVVYVTTNFVENMGPTQGLPKYLLRVALTLVGWGHKVSVITCSNRTVEYSFCGIKVYRVRRPNIVLCGDEEKDTRAQCYRDGMITNDMLKKLIEKETIDIIQYVSLCGLAIFHDNDIPAVMRLSSYASLWPVPGHEIAQDVYAWFERNASEKCDAVFGPSRFVADRFASDIGRKVDVIETPFVMENEVEDLSIYKEFLYNKKYILFFGTIIGYKGLLTIAESIYDILNKHRDVEYVLIGNGDKRIIDRIKKEAAEYGERVHYFEAISFEKLKPIIRNSFFVTLPSLAENFANACVEAMALESIVIGTNGTSFEQLIDDGINGLLCEPNNPSSFVSTVDRALSMSKLEQDKMRKEAANRAKRLEPEIVVRDLLEYYRHIIACHN